MGCCLGEGGNLSMTVNFYAPPPTRDKYEVVNGVVVVTSVNSLIPASHPSLQPSIDLRKFLELSTLMLRKLCSCLPKPASSRTPLAQHSSCEGHTADADVQQATPDPHAGSVSTADVLYVAASSDILVAQPGASTAQDSGSPVRESDAGASTAQDSGSPAHAELEKLCSSVLQVLGKAPDDQHAELVKLDVLKQCTKVLDALDLQDKPSTASKKAGVTGDTLKSWDGALTGADKLFAAVAKSQALGKNWSDLGAAGQELAKTLAGAAYVGPVFALVGFALKQWSMAAKVPADAALLLRSCRDLLADIHSAWPHLVDNPGAKQRAEAAIQDTAKLINDTIVIRSGSLICRFFMAQVNKDDLTKAAEKLASKRASLMMLQLLQLQAAGKLAAEHAGLMTRLLLQLQPAPVVHQPLAGGDVYGFQQQEADLAAQLLLPGPQVLWLHGMGGSGKSTMATQLYNRLVFGVPETELPGFAHSAFLELEGRETRDQLQALLLKALKQLGATGFNELAPAAELQTALAQFARQNPVLLVLDNVWTVDQLDLLLPTQLHAGSRVIITSRQDSMQQSAAWQDMKRQQLLLRAQVQPLDAQAAQQLFSHWAGMGSEAQALPEQLQQLQVSVVDACGSLPLALRVAGGLLYEETDARVWQEVLEVLLEGASIANAETDDLLRGVVTKSFKALSSVAQNMLLDAVCVMHCKGSSWCSEELALGIWGSLHPDGVVMAWRELQRRSLITVDAASAAAAVFHVHDVIKSLGRGIVKRDPLFCGSRVWVRHDGQVVQFGQGPTQLQPMVAACLDQAADGRAAFVQLTECDLAHLHILVASGCRLGPTARQVQPLSALTGLQSSSSNQLSGQLQQQLSALTSLPQHAQARVHVILPRSLGPSVLQLPQLTALTALRAVDLGHNELSGQLPEQWSTLTNLQAMQLGYNKLSGQLPEQWSALTNLRRLNLWYNQLSGQLPEQWSALNNLRELNLSFNFKLSGQLPEQWSALTNLRVLDLQINQLSGQLPVRWSTLVNLQEVEVNFNQLSGQLPEQWSALTNLQVLGLSRNRKLSQQLPEQWSALTSLRKMYLDSNQLSGQLPKQWSALTNLQELDLHNNQLSGQLPKQWSALITLQKMLLNNNPLSGQLPQCWSSLTRLQQLHLHCSGLSNQLPEQWSALTNLQQLDLSRNQLSGQLPKQWSTLTNLQELELHCNNLSGQLPEQWSALTGLQLLRLHSNQLSGQLPLQWSGLTNLQLLNLHSNQLSGQLPEQWSALHSLELLILFNNQLSGQLIKGWSALSALKELELYSNELSGPLPEQWSALVKLQALGLHDNQLSGQLPEQWSALTNLQELHLHSNQLSGQLSPQWSALTKLQLLNLQNNQLSGQLPEEWSALNSLGVLLFDNNQLSGQLPEQWSALTSLQVVDFHNNHLSGQLPEQWSALTNLWVLGLHCNNLSGQLPGQWAALVNLQGLNLHHNQLSGQLPERFSALTALKQLDFSYNRLSGQLPEQWSTLTDLKQLELFNNQLSGQLPQQWSALNNLQRLGLHNNQLSGHLPKQWSALADLELLGLHNNGLSGQPPQHWSALISLQKLYLHSNQLSGQLPEQWAALTNLQDMYLCGNQLSGQRPEQWSVLSHVHIVL